MIWTPRKLQRLNQQRRDLVGWALTSGLLGGLSSQVWAAGKLPRELPPGRSVYLVEGKTKVDGKMANRETQINTNSLIETDTGGQIIFAVDGDAFMLRSNTRVQLDLSNTVVRGLRLITGKLLSAFGGGQHRIDTSTATLGIRGTGIYVEAEPDRSYVCTCYGEVDLIPNNNPEAQERVSTSYHESPRYLLAKAENGKFIKPASVINHTDAEIILTEELVGRIPPFLRRRGRGRGDNGGY